MRYDGSPTPSRLLRDFFLGFIKIHVLFHTSSRPFYGQELKEELEEHGYSVSYGTLYPLLHRLCDGGYLVREDRNVDGKVRKYYRITAGGQSALNEARRKIGQLVDEVMPRSRKDKA